jgi:protein involved in polysaccharide export with SLBB domain
VFYRHRIAKLLDHSGGRGFLLSIRSRSPSRAVRLSLVLWLLLPFAAFCFLVSMTFPQARLPMSLLSFSNTLTHLLAGEHLAANPRQLAAAGATGNGSADVSPASSAIDKEVDRLVITYGDRLKITFFESMGIGLNDGGAASEHVVATVFPRMDLSAEYAVDEGGTVNIPKLGQFMTANQSIPAIQSELAAAFSRTIGRTSDVHVAIVDRQPVYVLGAVRNAGTFKHTPGMIVLQALADAGGTDPGVADTSKAIESIRETERLRQAEGRYDRLMIKQARLVAQRESSDRIAVPANIKSRLSEAAPHDGLSALMAEAAVTLSVELKGYQQQLSLAQRQVEIARIEREAQGMRADQLKILLADKENRLHQLEEIAARGSVPNFKLTDVRADVSEVAVRQEDLRVAFAQAERRLVEAEMARTKIEFDHSVGLENELAATQQDIDDCAQAIASMRAVTLVLRNSLPQLANDGTTSLRITRRGAGGLTVIPATDTTLLQPGDVVQVNFGKRTDAPASGIAQDTQHLQD